MDERSKAKNVKLYYASKFEIQRFKAKLRFTFLAFLGLAHLSNIEQKLRISGGPINWSL
jgi:hypothetical protein